MSIPALSRLRRASDQQILAERTTPPFSPLTWPGGALEPPTDVYGEVIDTDGVAHRTPNYRADSARLRAIQGGQILAGTFARNFAATYVDAGGTERTAASGVARDAHYIGGERTLLLEPMRTNLLPQSALSSTASWAVVRGTIAADSFRETVETGPHIVYAKPGVELIGAHAFTLRFRPVGRRHIRIVSYTNAGSTAATAWLDSATGTITASSFTTLVARPLAGGAWEVAGTYTVAGSGTNSGVGVQFSPDGATTSYAGDPATGADSVRAQLVAGASATSYIPTSGVIASRAADVLTLQLPAGALYLRYLDPWSGAVTDSVSEQAGGAYTVPVGSGGRAYTHLVVSEPGRTIAQMRRLAGVA